MADLHYRGLIWELKILANGLKRANLFAGRAPNGQRSATDVGGSATYDVQLYCPISMRYPLCQDQ
jgi:hypothetical protein